MQIVPRLKYFLCALTLVIAADCGLFSHLAPWGPSECEAARFICDLCTWVTDEEAKRITPDSTEEEIIYVVHNVCSTLPPFITSACNDFIEEYGPQNIHWLLEKKDPHDVCGLMGVCP